MNALANSSGAPVRQEDLVTFEVGGVKMRIIPDRNGSFVAIASDLAKALGNRSTKDLTKYVSDEYKGGTNCPTPGGSQEMTTITEPGVYEALTRSRSKAAKPIQRKLFEEILPSIRKTGRYDAAPRTDDEVLALAIQSSQKAMVILRDRLAIAEESLEAAEGLLTEQRPIVDWVGNLTDSKGLFSYRTAVRMAGVIGHQRLTRDLKDALDGRGGFFVWEAGYRVWRADLRDRGLGKNVQVLVNGDQEEYPPRFYMLGIHRLEAFIRNFYRQKALPLDAPRKVPKNRQGRIPQAVAI